jgi:peptidoglycan/LPS O-acetylase OafA/YrhL
MPSDIETVAADGRTDIECSREPNHYHYIDALRGIAIFGVMAVHAAEVTPELGGAWRAIIDQGARGVQLFFVASALTLSLSWHKRRDGLLPFYIRRLFRIAPLFWLFIVVFLLINGFAPRYFAPNGITINFVLQTFFFIHGWTPETITSVVPGAWSIADEMIFYVIFPAVIWFCRSLRLSIIALLLTSIFARFSYDFAWARRAELWPGTSDSLMSTFLNLWLPYQLPVFIIGICLYHIIKRRDVRLGRRAADIVTFIAIGCLMALPFAWLTLYIRSNYFISNYLSYAMAFALFAYGLSQGGGKIFNCRFFRFLGLISYSAYLWHFTVLALVAKPQFGFLFAPYAYLAGLVDGFSDAGFVWILKFGLVLANLLAVTIPLSLATHQFIEIPMVAVGKRITQRIAG